MKIRGLGLIAGAAIIAGMLYAGMANTKRDREDQRVREACLSVGEVPSDCPSRFTDVPRCLEEDCGDIHGLVGFWHDKGEDRWFLVRSPWTVDGVQGPAEKS